jgi:DNA-binding NarL/FixJ family response regulator
VHRIKGAETLSTGVRITTMARILIADDHQRVRKALRALLECRADWQVVGEAANGREAVEKAELLQPDLVILDITMPEMDGLTAARQIRRSANKVEVLILSYNNSSEMIRQAFDAGAHSFVLKTDLGYDLMLAVETVCQGRTFLSRSILGSAPTDLGPPVTRSEPSPVTQKRKSASSNCTNRNK